MMSFCNGYSFVSSEYDVFRELFRECYEDDCNTVEKYVSTKVVLILNLESKRN